MKSINEISDLSGKRVLIRSSLNVALDDNGVVVDDLRLRRTLETIDYVFDKGGIPILISHIVNDQGSTLEPIKTWYQDNDYQVELTDDYLDHELSFDSGILYILENLRRHDGEKANSDSFAWKLAQLGDVYVNESFDSAHRSHASTVALPKLLPSYSGFNFNREVIELSKTFDPDRPFTFIIGGAKFETKAPLITKLLDMADKVFVGGALQNPPLSAIGYEIGGSLMPDKSIDLGNIISHPNLVLPVDFIDQHNNVIGRDEIESDTVLMDIGPESIKSAGLLIDESDLVVWNGPMGNYENGFSTGTDELVRMLDSSNAYSIVGGGDTLASIDDQIESQLNWISTGGGAMLDFIESDGALPAIRALE